MRAILFVVVVAAAGCATTPKPYAVCNNGHIYIHDRRVGLCPGLEDIPLLPSGEPDFDLIILSKFTPTGAKNGKGY